MTKYVSSYPSLHYTINSNSIPQITFSLGGKATSNLNNHVFDRQKANVSPLSLTQIVLTIFRKMHTDTLSSSVISDISHFPSSYQQPSVDIPQASRAEPETVRGSKNSSSTQLSVPNMSEHVFNIPLLNMHETKYSGLHCLLSDEHCFEIHQLLGPRPTKSVVFPREYR